MSVLTLLLRFRSSPIWEWIQLPGIGRWFEPPWPGEIPRATGCAKKVSCSLLKSGVKVVGANVQEQDSFLIEENELDSVRVVYPGGIRLFVLAVQLVSSQRRVERVFPESKFLLLDFFLHLFREFSVVLLEQTRYLDGLDSHSARLLSTSFRNRGLSKIGWPVFSLFGILAIPCQRADRVSLQHSLSDNT